MLRFKFIIILLFPLSLLSQNITGKVYDAESTVKGAKIYNSTKNISTYTDDKGDFKLSASINDTLVFTSLFHKEKRLKLTENHFNKVIVIELKKVVNDLDEVLITKENKTFNEQKHTADMGLQFKNDIKNNPHLYGATPAYGVDLVQVISFFGKLLKKKKTKENPVVMLNYKQLDSLFSKSDFFNNSLLINDLKIPETYRVLFFNYCDAKSIDSKLLLKQNEILLLDKLFTYSKEFKNILSDYQKGKFKN